MRIVLAILLAHLAWGQQYMISTFAGGPPPLTMPALEAILFEFSIAVDSGGSVYLSGDRNCVFRLDASGTLQRVAGIGVAGHSGDGGPATSAQLSPRGIAVDGSNNLYIVDASIRKISADGIITTVARIDGYIVQGIAADPSGILYIAESSRILKVSPDGIITTMAGTGTEGYSGDGGMATNAQITARSIAIDNSGNLYIGGYSRIRKVSPDGIITTVAGTGNPGYSGDGGPAISAKIYAGQDGYAGGSIAVDGAGNLYIGDLYNRRIRKVSPDGIITTVAGTGTNGSSGDGGPATSAQLALGKFVAADSSGNIYITDWVNLSYDGTCRIRKISADGIITTVAGGGSGGYGDGGPAPDAQLVLPVDLALDAFGNLYISDEVNYRIRKVSADGIITTAAPWYPEAGIAVDRSGNLYEADPGGVYRVSAAGTISFVTGYGKLALRGAVGLAIDGVGNFYVTANPCELSETFCDYRGQILKVTSDGAITTLAGDFKDVNLGDGGPASNALLQYPTGVTFDSSGNMYIAECVGHRIRKVTPDGIITTVAGTGTRGYSGDDGPATSAQLSYPTGVAVDAPGNLYIRDGGNNRIRKVSPDGIITTVAGTGTSGYSGDGGLATSAQLSTSLSGWWDVGGIAVDSNGEKIYLADTNNRVIRLLEVVR